MKNLDGREHSASDVIILLMQRITRKIISYSSREVNLILALIHLHQDNWLKTTGFATTKEQTDFFQRINQCQILMNVNSTVSPLKGVHGCHIGQAIVVRCFMVARKHKDLMVGYPHTDLPDIYLCIVVRTVQVHCWKGN